jgi:PTS system N-acetylglucosamine-specific IIB component
MDQAGEILEAIGGPGNVIEIEACITRVRLGLRDPSLVDEAALGTAGVHGVKRSRGIVQLLVGPDADAIADGLRARL